MTTSRLRFLVTGGSGFIGTNLVEHLLKKGYQVLNLDKRPPKINRIERMSVIGDILDKPLVQSVFSEFQPTHVVHLAARTDLDGLTASDYASNTVGVENICAAALECASLERIILASSRLVNEIGYQPKSMEDYNPTTEYGRSKVEGERIARKMLNQRDLSWMIFRPTSIWGPWFGVPYRNFFDAIKAGRYLHPKGLKIKKTFGYVGNSVIQLDALSSGRGSNIVGETLYLADRQPIEVYSFASQIAEKMGVPRVPEVDERFLRGGAMLGNLLAAAGIKFPLTTFRLNNIITEMLYDTEAVCSIMDENIDIEAGIARTVDWMDRET